MPWQTCLTDSVVEDMAMKIIQESRRLIKTYVILFILSICAQAWSSQIDIPGPAGSGSFGFTVVVLPNGNFVVTDPGYSIPSGAANVGAVYLYDKTTRAIISTLTGSSAGDRVGNAGIVVLSGGNYIVKSTQWSNGAETFAGAVTWCNAATGINGAVNPANSLVGGMGDLVGYGVTALSNGNYVVSSPYWTNPTGSIMEVGAVTWCSSAGTTVGLVTPANSLVGGSVLDGVGSGGVTELTSGHYVVSSPFWNNPTGPVKEVGAVTRCNGTGGTVGLVTVANSLIGGTFQDRVGEGGVKPLANGNYVVDTFNWTNPIGPVANVGAVTWCNGSGVTVVLVTPGNSLVGGTAGDKIGNYGVTPLKNAIGTYVVNSPGWTNPTGPVTGAGAVTWGDGMIGKSGLVTPANSLVGGAANDNVGGDGVTALSNGNYVVASSFWMNPSGALTLAGAVTWCDGLIGGSGLITSGNSLVGGTANDRVGSSGVTALLNGNYVACSPNWTNPTGPVSAAGAATWCNATGTTVGFITPANSLVGATAVDQVGYNYGGVTLLTNGNYVVASPYWNNPAGPKARVGAATWCNASGTTVGSVTSANSLIGGTQDDFVGFDRAVALTNGNYVVNSGEWNNPSGPVSLAGAVTLCNGSGPTAGVVSSANSLVGGTTGDHVGSHIATAPLANGNYAVKHIFWDNPAGPIVDASAVSYGNSVTGATGLLTADNSVLGTVQFGTGGFSYDAALDLLYVGRSASNIVTVFVPDHPVPTLASISPTSATAGGATFTMTLTGTNFVSGSVVKWTGQADLAPTTQSATQLTVQVPASYIANTGTPAVSVFNPAPGGGTTAAQTFTVSAAPPPNVAPAITSATSTTFTVGASGSFTVTATGTPKPTLSFSGTLPTGVTFTAATGVLSGTPAAGSAGTYPLVFTAANGVGTNATQNFSLKVESAASSVVAPKIVSGPTATTVTAGIGQSIDFTAAASGSAPTLTWNFADGSGGEGANVSHAFLTAGTFNVTVTANNSAGSDSAVVSVTVKAPGAGAGKDSDGDGYSDEIETASGTDPLNASSNAGGGKPPEAHSMATSKLTVSDKRHTLSLTGKLDIPAGFSTSGKTCVTNVGGYMQKFTLDAKGSGKAGKNAFKLTLKVKKKVVIAQQAKFTLKLINVPETVTTKSAVQILIGETVFTPQ